MPKSAHRPRRPVAVTLIFNQWHYKLLTVAALLLAGLTGYAAENAAGRERSSFNTGWRFTKDEPAGAGSELSYAELKKWELAGSAELSTNAIPAATTSPTVLPTSAQPDFNDSHWRLLNLPHDWGVEGPF